MKLYEQHSQDQQKLQIVIYKYIYRLKLIEPTEIAKVLYIQSNWMRILKHEIFYSMFK